MVEALGSVVVADGLAFALAGWLATCALHGTLVVVLAWLGTRRLRSAAGRERAWKLALVGGCLSASVQLGLGVDPLGGALRLGRPEAPPTAMAIDAPASSAWRADAPATPLGALPARSAAPERPFAAPEPMSTGGTAGMSSLTDVAGAAGALDPAELGSARPGSRWDELVARVDLVRVALGAWLAIALVALAVWSGRWLGLARLLRDRRPVEGAPAELFAALQATAGCRRDVRLSASARLFAPITFGLVRSEVCLPERALVELGRDELRAMLAHELAHALRRDPLWLALAGVLERVLFFQPLARFARRRWQEEAELACDDLAVSWTRERLSLATCLTEVAGWLVREPRALRRLPVPSMAHGGGAGLGLRVRRLLEERPAERPARWLAPAAAALLASVVAAAPRVTSAGPADDVAIEWPIESPIDSKGEPGLEPAAPESALGTTIEPELALEPEAAPEPEPIEATRVIGPRGPLAAAVPPEQPEPALADLLRELDRSIALLEQELSAVELDGAERPELAALWAQRVERVAQRLARLRDQHGRLAELLVGPSSAPEPDAADPDAADPLQPAPPMRWLSTWPFVGPTDPSLDER